MINYLLFVLAYAEEVFILERKKANGYVSILKNFLVNISIVSVSWRQLEIFDNFALSVYLT